MAALLKTYWNIRTQFKRQTDHNCVYIHNHSKFFFIIYPIKMLFTLLRASYLIWTCSILPLVGIQSFFNRLSVLVGCICETETTLRWSKCRLLTNWLPHRDALQRWNQTLNQQRLDVLRNFLYPHWIQLRDEGTLLPASLWRELASKTLLMHTKYQ